MRVIILTVLAFAYVASGALVCSATSNPTAAPVCNTTALQSKLPAKACTSEPVSSFATDFTYLCTQAGYDGWVSGCPKKNLNVEGFCGGSSGTFCNLIACEKDSDCPSIAQTPTDPKQPCYDCCQVCQQDSYCDSNSGSGKTFAAKGSTDCNSCAVVVPTAAPVSSSAAIVAPVLSLIGAALF